MAEEVSGPSPEEDDDGPQTHAGKDFLAGFLRAIDIYFGDVEQGIRIADHEVSAAKEEALKYEESILMDPERQDDL